MAVSPIPESTDQITHLAVPVDLNHDHYLGRADAPVTLVEYGDYECPDCGKAYPLLKALQARFPDQLLFVFRHFPLYTLHGHASMAAQAAEAAGMQGKFWQMHDLLYEHQDRLGTPDLTHHALRLGLEVYSFEASVADGTYLRHVENDFAGGEKSGVHGTPTLFINGWRYTGPFELEPLAKAIEGYLGS